MKTGILSLKRLFSLLFAAVMLFSCLSLGAYAAAYDFEAQLLKFPTSYRSALRELHEKYPLWEFVPVDTGLDFSKSVNSQYRDDISLVSAASAYSDFFRSMEADDYNYSEGKFIQKDAGFAKASKLAVAYYLDPRNFLDETSVFLFEQLSFDSSMTVEDVETIIKGTYMSNSSGESKKISYVGGTVKKNSKGEYVYTINTDKNGDYKLIESDDRYADVIYNAGKTYNINPCFLASKIVNEVGRDGSASVSGTQKDYPGIYNYYNIGAYDSANPILLGLKYAASSGTYAPASYGRPWTSPQKAIMGGAQFNANAYISAGQDTDYFQKFNVSPDAANDVHTHQYMTNLSGAVCKAQTRYYAYKENDLLNKKIVFKIPYYDDMPATGGTATIADVGSSQTAVATDTCYVRTGPSTSHGRLSVMLNKGTSVTVLDTVMTDAVYFDTVLRYPYWSQISFKSGSKTYTGYVYANFLDITSKKSVLIGSYTPKVTVSKSSVDIRLLSTNANVAVIENDKTIRFKKAGDVTIIFYDSTGRFDRVKYTVSNIGTMSAVTASSKTASGYTLKWKSAGSGCKYEIYSADANSSSFKKLATVSTLSYKVTGQSPLSAKKYKVRAVLTTNDGTVRSPFSSVITVYTLPSTPTGFKQTSTGAKGYTLTWSKVENADGYRIYKYDSSKKKYVKLADTTALSYKISGLKNGKKNEYKIKAYASTSQGRIYSATAQLTAYCDPAKVTGLKQTNGSTGGYTLTWNKCQGATHYQVYVYDTAKKKFVLLKTVTKNSLAISGKKPGQKNKYKVRAYINSASGKLYGSYSAEYQAAAKPVKPASLKASKVKKTSLVLSFSKSKGAQGYIIYQKAANGSYKKLATTSGTTYTVTGLTASKSYSFKVKAYKKTTSLTVMSASSAAVTVKTKK